MMRLAQLSFELVRRVGRRIPKVATTVWKNEIISGQV